MASKTQTPEHNIIPKHSKLSEADKKTLFKTLGIGLNELPKIKINDPAIATLNLKQGDIVKIERISPYAGKSIFYRGVINE